MLVENYVLKMGGVIAYPQISIVLQKFHFISHSTKQYWKQP